MKYFKFFRERSAGKFLATVIISFLVLTGCKKNSDTGPILQADGKVFEILYMAEDEMELADLMANFTSGGIEFDLQLRELLMRIPETHGQYIRDIALLDISAGYKQAVTDYLNTNMEMAATMLKLMEDYEEADRLEFFRQIADNADQIDRVNAERQHWLQSQGVKEAPWF